MQKRREQPRPWKSKQSTSSAPPPSLRSFRRRRHLSSAEKLLTPHGQPATGTQTTCGACPPGKHQAATGKSECAACNKGSFSEEEQATACTPCPEGVQGLACRGGHFVVAPGFWSRDVAVATGVGCGFLAAAAPFLVFSNDYDTASDVFVGERYRYTFERPLGSF